MPTPFIPPPLPRQLLVRQASQLERKAERLRAEGARPEQIQRVDQRLGEARKMVKQAGGTTERKLLFSIMEEEGKKKKLTETGTRIEAAIREAEKMLKRAAARLDHLKVSREANRVLVENSRKRIQFLATEKAAEVVHPEHTAQVQGALYDILRAIPPELAQQAGLVANYFKHVAPLSTRQPNCDDDIFTDCETVEGDTSDSGEPVQMEGQVVGDQGRKRRMDYQQVLPVPAVDTNDIDQARREVERIRKQKMRAIGNAFSSGQPASVPPADGTEVEIVPILPVAELADLYDRELRRAMDQLQAAEAAARASERPTPCAKVDCGSREADVQEVQATARRRRSRWDSDDGGKTSGAAASSTAPPATSEVACVGEGASMCPGCGGGPFPATMLVGVCECCAAGCSECSQGGAIMLNACLLCHKAEKRTRRRRDRDGGDAGREVAG